VTARICAGFADEAARVSEPFRRPVEVGDRPPPIELPNQVGALVSSLANDLAGHPLVLVFAGSGDPPPTQLRAAAAIRPQLRAVGASVLAVIRQAAGRARLELPVLADPQGAAFRALGLDPAVGETSTLVLDANHRVAAVLGGPGQAARALEEARALAGEGAALTLAVHPPVLVMARALAPEMCARLIALAGELGRQAEGEPAATAGSQRFLREYGKARQHTIRDKALEAELDGRLGRRLAVEMAKAFQTVAPRREPWRVAAYDAAESGHLPAHRDNVNEDTRHRRFTVSVALNGGFEGGRLCFREYGDHLYEVAPGTAIVWSASQLHEVTAVTRGCRYTLVTHLFGEAGQRPSPPKPPA
jgi:predicted 2-oxoglutarate/Fe(II)-dependent dioxygenase YbiX/peroxiredoxin